MKVWLSIQMMSLVGAGHLLGGKGNAGHKLLGFGKGEAGIHQRFELGFVIAVAVEAAIAGEAGHLFVDQFCS